MTNERRVSFTLAASFAALLTACGNDQETTVVTADSELPGDTSSPVPLPVIDSLGANDQNVAQAAVVGASEIPYPVYPNGSKYRVGGENGLKIVVFETEDDFEQVDSFYKNTSETRVMPRLIAMNDYVRYSSSDDDRDPWATYRPGIVIHEFNDSAERSAVGAKPDSRTNIIMSF